MDREPCYPCHIAHVLEFHHYACGDLARTDYSRCRLKYDLDPDFFLRDREQTPAATEPPKRTIFERFLQFVVPAAASIVLLFQQQRRLAWALIALAFASLAVSIAPPVTARLRTVRARRAERRIAGAALVSLRRHIHNFEPLVCTRTSDTLHYIVTTNLCGNNVSECQSLQLGPSELFSALWDEITTRSAFPLPSYATLKDSIVEFNFLISYFSRYFVCPVYENIPSKLPASVAQRYSKHIENDLIMYRERYIAFLDTYSAFLRDLDQTLPMPFQLGYYFQRPQPVQRLSSATIGA